MDLINLEGIKKFQEKKKAPQQKELELILLHTSTFDACQMLYVSFFI
jgi:hypothetical protein